MNGANALALIGLLVLAGCASERVVLLPSADGQRSAVVVRTAAGEQRLIQPYAAAAIGPGGNALTYVASEDHVAGRFAGAIAAQPPRPLSFVVYFIEGSDALTPESAEAFAKVKEALQARPAAEILVVGHTDRVGTVQYNDGLALKRAQAVKEALVAAGLPAQGIDTAGRGEREPVVPTADEVAEPRNRRVEISVR